jgi:CheY-like chemotaxis protein
VCLPNGLRIRTALGEQPVDAVLTALYMPECDGIETIATLRSMWPALPIIGMTVNAGVAEDPCSRAMRLFGAVAVIEKPIDREALLALLDGVLAEAAAVRAGRTLRRPAAMRVA